VVEKFLTLAVYLATIRTFQEVAIRRANKNLGLKDENVLNYE